MIYESILDLIGKTPSVRLNKIVGEDMAEVYIKLEGFNPSGSVKDRAVYGMIRDMVLSGKLKEGGKLVEPTSGNTGIGIALIAALKGYELVITMPDTMSVERRKMISAYGAKIVLTDGKLGMKGAIEKAKELVEKEGYIMVSQFDNPSNPAIHTSTTAKENLEDFSNLDAFVSGVGTGGTVSGVGKGLKNAMENIQIVAVEPEESPVLSGGNPSLHKIQGIGAGFVPANYDASVVDEVITVNSEDALKTARELAQKEGIFVGISSGATVFAALQMARRLGKGKRVLAVAADGGEKYLSVDGLF